MELEWLPKNDGTQTASHSVFRATVYPKTSPTCWAWFVVIDRHIVGDEEVATEAEAKAAATRCILDAPRSLPYRIAMEALGDAMKARGYGGPPAG